MKNLFGSHVLYTQASLSLRSQAKFKTKLLLFFVFIFVTGKTEAVNPIPMDIVFCMDLSGSTNGLLLRFKERYWEIITEAEKFNPPVKLRIGFISYSRPSNGADNMYVRVIHPLTDDFDALAMDVFEIKTITEIGQQYVGFAVQAALDQMEWSEEKEAIKMIFAVGNGSPYMGGKPAARAFKRAKSQNIPVNTIYCLTPMNYNDHGEWRGIAKHAGGYYGELDINKKLPPYPVTETRKQIELLNTRLNQTYVPYGPNGAARYRFMQEQDELLKSMSVGPFSQRVFGKCSSLFLHKNPSWDLVDLSLIKKIKWESIDSTTLNPAFRRFSVTEKEMFLEKQWQERRKIASSIRSEFQKWKAEYDTWKKEKQFTDGNTFNSTVIYAMTEIAARKGVLKK